MSIGKKIAYYVDLDTGLGKSLTILIQPQWLLNTLEIVSSSNLPNRLDIYKIKVQAKELCMPLFLKKTEYKSTK